MAWKTTTAIYNGEDLVGTDASSSGNLAKDINDFLTANDGTLDATTFPQISITRMGASSVLVTMSIENSA